MLTTSLRKVRGSVMLAVPPAILDQLRLHAGSTIGLSVDGERLVIDPQTGPRFKPAELLEQSDYASPQPPTEREWVDSLAVGGELL